MKHQLKKWLCVLLIAGCDCLTADETTVNCDGDYVEYHYSLQQQNNVKTPHLPGCDGIFWLPDNGSLQLCKEMAGDYSMALVDKNGFITWKENQEEEFLQYSLKALINACGSRLILIDRFGEQQYGASVYFYGSPQSKKIGTIPLVGDNESLVNQVTVSKWNDGLIFRFKGDVYEWKDNTFNKLKGEDVIYQYDGKKIEKQTESNLIITE